MPLNVDEYKKIAFSTNFNYLHVVLSGQVTTSSTATIALPAGLTNPLIRVYMDEGTQLIPVVGFVTTGSDAYVKDGVLTIKSYGGSGGSSTKTFYYFVYGGNYV